MNENFIAFCIFVFAAFTLYFGLGNDPLVSIIVTNFLAFLAGRKMANSNSSQKPPKIKLP